MIRVEAKTLKTKWIVMGAIIYRNETLYNHRGDVNDKIVVIGQLATRICWKRGEYYGKSGDARLQK